MLETENIPWIKLDWKKFSADSCFHISWTDFSTAASVVVVEGKSPRTSNVCLIRYRETCKAVAKNKIYLPQNHLWLKQSVSPSVKICFANWQKILLWMLQWTASFVDPLRPNLTTRERLLVPLRAPPSLRAATTIAPESIPSLYKVSFKVHLVENYASYQSLSKKNLDIQT